MAQSRYIPHSGRPPSDGNEILEARRDIQAELAFSLRAIHRHQTTKHGVYVGAPGMLLMQWTLMDIAQSLRDTEGNSILPPKPDLYSWFPFQKPTTGSRTGFLETDIGAATLILVSDLREGLLDMKGGTDRSRASAILIREAIQVAVDGNDPLDDDGCEVLYGRAGLLYALLLLKSEIRTHRLETQNKEKSLDAFSDIVEQLCHEQNIAALVNEIIARGKRGAKLYASEARSCDQANGPALMWSWHGKRYLGGAHGVAGILQMLVSAPSYMLRRHWDAILNTVQWLVDHQDPDTGSWTHKASRDLLDSQRGHLRVDSEDTVVQWCHGAPGILILFSTLLRQEESYGLHLPESLCNDMRDALIRGSELIYERGLLRKGVGLCHGVSGSVYTLLAISDVLDGPSSHLTQPDPRPIRSTRSKSQLQPENPDPPPMQWFSRALHLAHLAASYRKLTQQGQMRSPDRPVSLYEGLAGMCCAWAEVLRRLDTMSPGTSGDSLRRGIPGYNDLPQ